MGNTLDVYQAISDVNRRRLLEMLCEKECAVRDLVPHFPMTFGAVSQHLKVLRDSGLVTRRKRGRFRYYRAAPRALDEVHAWTERYRRFWEARLDRLGEVLDGMDGEGGTP